MDHPGVYYGRPSKSYLRQESVVIRGQKAFDKKQRQLIKSGKLTKFAFISDTHLPLEDRRAISLIRDILADYQPDIATSMNDWLDLTEYSRWQDLRPSWARLWTDDIQNAIDYSGAIRADWMKASPNTVWPAVLGNHDVRIWLYLAGLASGTNDFTIAYFMEEMEKQGILFLSNGTQNTLTLSPALKVWHGQYASKNPATVAKSTLEALRGQSYEYDAGKYYNVVYGHDHRSIEAELHGVTAYGAGCTCVVDMPYLNGRRPDWQHGIVVGEYDPSGNFVNLSRVEFRPDRKGRLQTVFNGTHYVSSV
jgi:hypothetical protein